MFALFSRIVVLAAVATAFAAPLPASAVESHNYHGQGGYTAAFTLAGGQYSLYVDAHYTPGLRTHNADFCIFSAALKRVSPTKDSVQIGNGVPVRNPIHFRLGPAPMTLPAGTYQFFVASMSDCEWTFSLEATAPKAAGVDPINLYRVENGQAVKVDGSWIGGTVEFNAQYGLGSAQTPPSGTIQILHNGKVMIQYPLRIGTDPITHAPAVYSGIDWDQNDVGLIGQNVVRFVVKIGSSTYTQQRTFTLQQQQ